MTLGDFIMDTMKEVLAEENSKLSSAVAQVPSSDPSRIATLGACRSKKQGRKRLVTEKMIIEAFESGASFVCSPGDLLTPSAQDALAKYKNK